MPAGDGSGAVPPPWFLDSIIYELHLRAFYDANGDGVGDFAGALAKLDYLSELGVTALWLLPFFPSPLRDAGYDISDYRNVHPIYGSLDDFRRFLDAAHDRGLRVIIELVLNHTSDQHPWFVASRRAAPGSPERARYVWSPTDQRYRDARIIFRDSEPSNWTWDPEARAYFWHRFYRHQPDLNYDDPATERAIQDVAAFWFEFGVDGLRLDAAPYLCEREGTICENLPETHAILRRLRAAIDQRFEGRLLLAEANEWPDEAAAFFGKGDECHMAFHFPLMPRMFMALQLEDRRPLVDILAATPPIPDGCQWALFLRNHDELTLEMVTDEERDYMHRAYARDARGRINLGIRRRLAPLMGGDRRKIELMELFLFTLPGTPVLYYGDEILMGDDESLGDRDSVRTPMQWNGRRNAGFSKARRRNLYLPLVTDPEYHFDVVNVETQQANLDSHLWWLKRLIRMRRRFPTFGRGPFQVVLSTNPHIFSFVRRGEQDLLVVGNLAHSTQTVDLPLREFEGRVPVDLFGGTRFAAVRQGSLPLALGPYGYYALSLGAPGASPAPTGSPTPSEVAIAGDLSDLWRGAAQAKLESEVLPTYLFEQPWFGSTTRRAEFVRVRDAVSLGPEAGDRAWVAIVDVYYPAGPPETYALPLAAVSEGADARPGGPAPDDLLARLRSGGARWQLRDGLGVAGVRDRLERIARQGGTIAGSTGRLEGDPGPSAPGRPGIDGRAPSGAAPVPIHLTVRRHLLEGPDAEVEVARHFGSRGVPGILPLLGTVAYVERGATPLTLAIVSAARPDAVPLSVHCASEIARFLAAVRERRTGPPDDLRAALEGDAALPAPWDDVVGSGLLDLFARLGRRIAGLHRSLLEGSLPPELAPAPFDSLYQASLAYAMGGNARRTLDALTVARDRGIVPPADVDPLISDPSPLYQRFRSLREARFESVRLLIHGDLTLDRVLVAGEEIWVTGWGRDQGVTKRSPLRDVAGLLRSLRGAANHGATAQAGAGGSVPLAVDQWAHVWYRSVAKAFEAAYEGAVAGTPLVPSAPAGRRQLLEALLLDGYLSELREGLAAPGGGAGPALRSVYDLLGDPIGPTSPVRPLSG